MADAARIHKELGEIYELARALKRYPIFHKTYGR